MEVTHSFGTSVSTKHDISQNTKHYTGTLPSKSERLVNYGCRGLMDKIVDLNAHPVILTNSDHTGWTNIVVSRSLTLLCYYRLAIISVRSYGVVNC
jgi:hypothetical protein